jgi:hypothetical protein
MEPTTVTTSSFVMPSPTQLIIGGVALGVGLTAGYGLACWTASLVDSGLSRSGIKDKVNELMGADDELEEEDEEVEDELEEGDEEDDDDNEIEDELEDEEEDDEDDEKANNKIEDEEIEDVKDRAKKAREKASA